MVTQRVQFARSGDVDVAYQVVGDGPIDLVYVSGSITHLEVLWELPAYRRYCERLAEFSRVILFDKRGMGMSDRVPGATTLETRMDDVRAVMDAVGSERAVLMGESEGGPLSILFAAAHPERTRALVLQGAEVRERKDDAWPWGEATDDAFEASMATIRDRWGTKDAAAFWRWLAPSVEPDPWLEDFAMRLERNAATPAAAEAFVRMAFDIDVRDVVPTIHVPALILHRVEDHVCHVGNARWLAAHLPDARYLELPGADHVAWFEPDQILAEIREFLTGAREPAEPERVLGTVLFVDLVGSTERAAAIGDAAWVLLLERFRQAVRHELQRFRGDEVDTAGDGFFVRFDGPARAIRCASAIVEAAAALDLAVRGGVHTGELEIADGKPAGIAVNIGARISAMAAPDEVLVSSTVRDLVAGSGLIFEDRGERPLKGVPGAWRLFAVAP